MLSYLYFDIHWKGYLLRSVSFIMCGHLKMDFSRPPMRCPDKILRLVLLILFWSQMKSCVFTVWKSVQNIPSYFSDYFPASNLVLWNVCPWHNIMSGHLEKSSKWRYRNHVFNPKLLQPILETHYKVSFCIIIA